MSHKINDKELIEAMKNQQKANGMLDKDSFWNEFKEKAQHIKQDGEVSQPILFMSGWAKAAACFIVIAGLISILFVFNGKTSPTDKFAVIEDYEILSAHSGVLIIEDEEESGTILWITGLNENNPGG